MTPNNCDKCEVMIMTAGLGPVVWGGASTIAVAVSAEVAADVEPSGDREEEQCVNQKLK